MEDVLGGAAAPAGNITLAFGSITADRGLKVTATLNSAGATFVPLDVNATRTAAAAASRLARVRQDGNAVFEIRSVASAATGLEIIPAASGSRAGLAVLSSGVNEGLDIDAKGSGTIRLGNTSTGAITLNRSTTLTSGVTLTLTGVTVTGGTFGSSTLTAPTIADLTNAGHTHQNAAGGGTLDAAAVTGSVTGSGNVVKATSPTLTTPTVSGDLTMSTAVSQLVPGATSFAIRNNADTVDNLFVTNAGLVAINDTADANMTVGLVINQGANDDEILALKSSDVAHGITDIAETDTFAALKKTLPTDGGLRLSGFADTGSEGLRLEGYAVTDDTTKADSSAGYIALLARQKFGTGAQAPGANANLVTISTGAATTHIFDADGDISVTGSATIGTYDDQDDLALVEAVRLVMMGGAPVGYQTRFAEQLDESKAFLAANRIITLKSDGTVDKVSLKGLLALVMDAVRQVGHRQRDLEGRVRSLLEVV